MKGKTVIELGELNAEGVLFAQVSQTTTAQNLEE